MRLVKFFYNKRTKWGILKENEIEILKESPFPKIILSKKKIPLNKVKIIAPANPTKIILIGLNYKDHAKELKMKRPAQPIIFLKPPTSLVEHKGKIIYPRGVKRLDYEAELAVVIKKKAKDINKYEVPKFILGYTCLNDVTARDLQAKDIQWTRAKSFDTFCPLGPWLETDIDPSRLRIRAYLNGKMVQNSCTSNFIFSLNFLISFISKIMTLFPGDVISTGTPPGVGPMRPFDTVDIEIDGIGKLENYVVPRK